MKIEPAGEITGCFFLFIFLIFVIIMEQFRYCNTLEGYSRRKTRVVHVGEVPLGGDYPVRIQTMLNVNTLDTAAVVNQIEKVAAAGADYVRIAVPSLREARHLAVIRRELSLRKISIPLIADVHFNPEVAYEVVPYVEKVRINPGNFGASRNRVNYSSSEYREELDKVEEQLKKLVALCKTHHTAIRIGVNHGSLPARIMSRYGDTPQGMVEAAMEFLRMLAAMDFHEVVVSMKASNTRLVVQATRLLVHCMMKENMDYPLHLGVTEAGEGEDGRIRSAVAIGALLADGLGDTVRISLAEDPVNEIPVAWQLINYYTRLPHEENLSWNTYPYHPFEYKKRETTVVDKAGLPSYPVVITDVSIVAAGGHEESLQTDFRDGFAEQKYSAREDKAPDYFYTGDVFPDRIAGTIPQILNSRAWMQKDENIRSKSFPLYTVPEILNLQQEIVQPAFLFLCSADISEKLFSLLEKYPSLILVVGESRNVPGFHEQRKVILTLTAAGFKHPVVVFRKYPGKSIEEVMLYAAADTGALFLDGLADGLWLGNTDNIPAEKLQQVSFDILQASRVRMSKTEYIACPSCGRTQFDLPETLARIKAATGHLKGLKIAVMGCIVNGPGEMADADYGYVGSGKDKVSLYKGKQLVKTGIGTKEAVNELIALIKANGDWKEP